jgi:hypothetical protein
MDKEGFRALADMVLPVKGQKRCQSNVLALAGTLLCYVINISG